MNPWPPGIFVVGTDTGVGKTRVAAALARTWMRAEKRVGVLKPVSTGATRSDGVLRSPDVAALRAAITTEGSPFPPPPLDRVGPLVFEAPLAPPGAARLAGIRLEPDAVIQATESAIEWWTDAAGADLLVIEGVGGLLCPLAEGAWTVADLAIHLDYPLLIVAHRGLGTLNHTMMTVEAARSRGLRVAGVILNASRPPLDPIAEATNAAELSLLLPFTPIIADWDFDPAADPVPVGPEAGHWLDLAQTPRRVSRGTASVGAPTPVPPVPNQFPGSDDELLGSPDAAGLLGSSSGSASSTIPADEPSGRTLDPALIASGEARNITPRSELVHHDGPRWLSWRSVLLPSYASSLTLALIWTLYQQRAERRLVANSTASVGVMAVDHFSDRGRLGDRSRQVTPPRPIPEDRRIVLGQSRQFGSLRVEPLTIARQNLTLARVNLVGKLEKREGPWGAIVLKVRLENRSPDLVFAPVDPEFVRGRSDNLFETFLELDDGRKVYPEPLSVASEWAIVGESFADLRPGESREVVFATEGYAPDYAERLPGLWRIKLRTGLDATTEVGIRLPDRTQP